LAGDRWGPPAGPVNLPSGGHAQWSAPLSLSGDAWFSDLVPHDVRPGMKHPIAG